MRSRFLAVMVAAVLALLTLGQPAYAFGTRTSWCSTHFKSARAIVRGTIMGIDSAAIGRACLVKNQWGGHYIKWAAKPLTSYPANNSIGNIQYVKLIAGPTLTKIVYGRQTPWDSINYTSPPEMVWLLAHKVVKKPVELVYSYTVRTCTVTVTGTKLCAQGDYKAQYSVPHGVRVCMIAPDAKCGSWKGWNQ